MRNDDFEWDDRKAESNLLKHQISFTLTCLVFDDEAAIDELDDDDDEERFRRVGMAAGLCRLYASRSPQAHHLRQEGEQE